MASINAGLALNRSSLPLAMHYILQLAGLVENDIDGFFPLATSHGKSLRELANAADLLAAIETVRSGQLLAQGKSKIHPDFSFSVFGEMVELQFVCDIGVGRIKAKFADHFAELLTAICTENIKLSGVCALGVRNSRIDRIRPPKAFGPIDTDSIVDLVSVDLDSHFAIQMRDHDLPAGVEKRIVNNALIVNWCPGIDLDNKDTIRACLELKQRWLHEYIEAPIADGWNAAGDSLFEINSAKPLEGFTLYDTANARGFVAVHRSEPERAVTRKIEDVSAMLGTGRVSGSNYSLEDCAVIASDRETAVALHRRYAQSQIRWFLYVDEAGLFNPFPAGRWQN
jgi:hypothetical protein